MQFPNRSRADDPLDQRDDAVEAAEGVLHHGKRGCMKRTAGALPGAARVAAIALAITLGTNSLIAQATKGKKGPAPSPTPSPQSEAMWGQIWHLSKRVAALEKTSTKFDPMAQPKFQRLDSNIGSFFVVLSNVERYMDGQRVTLKIGNPLSAKCTDYSFEASWGPVEPAVFGNWPAWRASLRSKSFSFSEALEAGHWNKVQFVLPDSSEGFRFLEISNFQVESVFMGTGPGGQ